jgi:hypothetical protein
MHSVRNRYALRAEGQTPVTTDTPLGALFFRNKIIHRHQECPPFLSEMAVAGRMQIGHVVFVYAFIIGFKHQRDIHAGGTGHAVSTINAGHLFRAFVGKGMKSLPIRFRKIIFQQRMFQPEPCARYAHNAGARIFQRLPARYVARRRSLQRLVLYLHKTVKILNTQKYTLFMDF